MNTFPYIVTAVGNVHVPGSIRWTVQKPDGSLYTWKFRTQRLAIQAAKMFKLGQLK